MTKATTTKRALLASVLSMALCLTMLVGSTFAWFTDSVTSGRNQILAGNLDVELYHTNGNVADEEVTGTTTLFVSKGDETFRWEPGAMLYENFTVKNVGSLALKYKLTLTAECNSVDNVSLADVLRVAVLKEAFNGDRAAAQAQDFSMTVAEFVKSGAIAVSGALEADTADTPKAVIIYWQPSDEDNAYNFNNGRNDLEPLSIDLGVTLVATQAVSESDSFGNDYDANIKLMGASSVINAPVQLEGDVILNEKVDLPDGKAVVLTGSGTLILKEGVVAPEIKGQVTAANAVPAVLVTGKDTVATIEGGRIASPSYYSVCVNDNAKLILGAGVELPDGIYVTAINGNIAENALTIKKGAKIGAYINLNNVTPVTTNCNVDDDGKCTNHTDHIKYIVIEDGEAVEEATFQGIDLGYIQIPEGYRWMKLSDSVENYTWNWKLVKDAAD